MKFHTWAQSPIVGNSPEDGEVHLPVHDSSQLWTAELAQLQLLVAVILLEVVKLHFGQFHLRLHDVLLWGLYRGFDRVSALQ